MASSRRLWTILLVAGLLQPVVIACTSPAPTTRPAAPPAATTEAPPSPPVPDATETQSHSTIRLVAITPQVEPIPGEAIEIVRTTSTKSTYLTYTRKWSTSKTVRHAGKGGITVRHRDLQFTFGVVPLDLRALDTADMTFTNPLGLSVVIRNSSPGGVQIDWNAVTILGKGGTVHPVLHRGVKMADRSGIQAPSTIPPGGALDEFVYPRNLVRFSSSRSGSSWLGENYFEEMSHGSRFTLYLPVKGASEATEYQFTFEVARPQK